MWFCCSGAIQIEVWCTWIGRFDWLHCHKNSPRKIASLGLRLLDALSEPKIRKTDQQISHLLNDKEGWSFQLLSSTFPPLNITKVAPCVHTFTGDVPCICYAPALCLHWCPRNAAALGEKITWKKGQCSRIRKVKSSCKHFVFRRDPGVAAHMPLPAENFFFFHSHALSSRSVILRMFSVL